MGFLPLLFRYYLLSLPVYEIDIVLLWYFIIIHLKGLTINLFISFARISKHELYGIVFENKVNDSWYCSSICSYGTAFSAVCLC